jgi:hypothetical protein
VLFSGLWQRRLQLLVRSSVRDVLLLHIAKRSDNLRPSCQKVPLVLQPNSNVWTLPGNSPSLDLPPLCINVCFLVSKLSLELHLKRLKLNGCTIRVESLITVKMLICAWIRFFSIASDGITSHWDLRITCSWQSVRGLASTMSGWFPEMSLKVAFGNDCVVDNVQSSNGNVIDAWRINGMQCEGQRNTSSNRRLMNTGLTVWIIFDSTDPKNWTSR